MLPLRIRRLKFLDCALWLFEVARPSAAGVPRFVSCVHVRLVVAVPTRRSVRRVGPGLRLVECSPRRASHHRSLIWLLLRVCQQQQPFRRRPRCRRPPLLPPRLRRRSWRVSIRTGRPFGVAWSTARPRSTACRRRPADRVRCRRTASSTDERRPNRARATSAARARCTHKHDR